MNAVYSAFLVLHRKTITRFKESADVNIGLTVTPALLWSGSNFVYSAGAQRMGSLDLILGWPIFMAVIVLMANLWGILTGE